MKHRQLFIAFLLGLVSSIEPLAASTVRLVTQGSEWRFLDDGSNPGTAWRLQVFDDSAWRRGPAELGYGDGDEVTLVRCRPDWPPATPCPGGGAADRILTTYFRRSFEVANPAAFDGLTLRLLQDDGALVYLNGVEVLRVNMPAGEVAYDTPALGPVSPENVFNEFPVVQSVLVGGTNVIAVEVHQRSPGSSDISFDLELTASAPDLPQLLRGPYLQLATPTNATVRWRTDVPVASRLAYGASPGDLRHTVEELAPKTEHELEIAGLSPDTRYFYALETGTAMLLPGDAERSFVTAPAAGAARPIRAWVIGDSGTANGDAVDVYDAYRGFAAVRDPDESGPDLWLMLGDNAYNTGTDAEYQAAVFDTYPALLQRSWLWPTIGNHDALSLDLDQETGPYFDIFTLPTSGEAGGIPSGTEAYYSFDFGNVHFISLNSMDPNLGPGSAMLQWLEADATATLRDWIVAFFHHPPYSKGSHDSDAPGDSGGRLFAMRESVLPILEAAGVDLVLSGHSHSYERSYLLAGHYGTSETLANSMIVDSGDGRPGGDGAYTKDDEGTVYVVAGSSGRLGGGTLDHPAMFLSLSRLGSLVLEIEGLRLDVIFLNETGGVDDELTLFKAPLLFADGFESGATAAWQ